MEAHVCVIFRHEFLWIRVSFWVLVCLETKGEGGAITSIDEGKNRIHLSIFHSFFGENRARIGGGVHTNVHVNITACKFVKNLSSIKSLLNNHHHVLTAQDRTHISYIFI